MNQAFRKALAIFACVSFVTRCQFGQPSISTSNIPPQKISVLRGQIVVSAPSGYCIDQDSLLDHRQSGFVLIAGCDGLMGLPSGTLIEPAIMTVSAFLPDQPYSDPLDVVGALAGATVLETRQADGVTLVHVVEPNLVPENSAAEHWRGAMVVNGAVLTMAVYGNDTVAADAGADLLQALVRQIKLASPAKADVQDSQRKKPKNLFQRIFN